MTTRRPVKAAAFTIIEIMIVVSIIALLAVLAIPAMMRARNRSLSTKCVANQRLIYDGVVRYEIDYNQTLQSIANNGVQVRNTLLNGGYVNAQVGFDCPSSPLKDYDDYRLCYKGSDLTNVTCTIMTTHVGPYTH